MTVAQKTRRELVEEALSRGSTELRCDHCGTVYPLAHQLGWPCNAAHIDNDNFDGQPCGNWDLSEVAPSVGAA